jgi:hypothetical protein
MCIGDRSRVSAGPTRKTDAAEACQKTKEIDSVEPAKYTKRGGVENACCKSKAGPTSLTHGEKSRSAAVVS